MRLSGFVRFVVCSMMLTSVAVSKEPTLSEKLSGTWMRPAETLSFRIQANNFEAYEAEKPGQASSVGTVAYPVGKDYAVVTTNKKYVWWVWAAGEGVVAVEIFNPKGALQGDGRVFYRQDGATR